MQAKDKWLMPWPVAPEFLPADWQLQLHRGEDISALSLEEGQFADPFLFQDMALAVGLIDDILNQNKRLLIYGDYDADGVSATALLLRYFSFIGQASQVDYFIPDRVDDGYGLNISILEDLVKKTDLIITVDCGVTSVDEVNFVRQHCPIIITDHHLPADTLPKADALINPHLEHYYPISDLSGVGVALKLVQALAVRRPIRSEQWEELYALAALGTVADCVPLKRENRYLVTRGLDAFNNGKTSPGLKALINVSRMDNRKIQTDSIAFQLAPRINAAGRLGSADTALKLLLASEAEAEDLAAELERLNEKRKALETTVYREALNLADNEALMQIIYSPDWPLGILGIVASRIMEHFRSPAILLTKENGILVGSGRSIEGIHLQKLLLDASPFLIKSGGHELAAGLSLEEENLAGLRMHLTAAVEEILPFLDRRTVYNIDMSLTPGSVQYELAEQLDKAGPYGSGNPAPLVWLGGVELVDSRSLSQGRHQKLVVRDGLAGVEGLLWNTAECPLDIGQKIHIVGELQPNEWQGIKSASVVIRSFSNVSSVTVRHKSEASNFLSRVYFAEEHDLLKMVPYRDFFRPIILRLYKDGYIEGNIGEDEALVLEDLPFFANDLLKLSFAEHVDLYLDFTKEDYEKRIALLESLAIDRKYLLRIYEHCDGRHIDPYVNCATLEERINYARYFKALEVLLELGLIIMQADEGRILVKNLKKQADLSHSTVLRNYTDQLNRSGKDALYLTRTTLDGLQTYVRGRQ